MLADLLKRLGLDKIGEVLAEEVRRLQVQVLEEERAILAKTISDLDERMAKLGGKLGGRPQQSASTIAAPTRPRRKGRSTPKSGETLKDFIVRTLAKAGGPVKVNALVDLVLEAGYRTNAKRTTLVTSAYNTLADRRVFRKIGKGVFALVTATATARKAVKSKQPSTAIARKPGETLQFFVLRAFRKAGGPMNARHLVKRVMQMGYETTSTPQNLVISVLHVLADAILFRKVGKGLYALALPSTTRRKPGRPKGRTKTTATTASREQRVEEPAPRIADDKSDVNEAKAE